MFDLEKIEKDWKDNSFELSEEEIIEIYKSDGATQEQYKEKVPSSSISAVDRLLATIFKDSQYTELIEEERKREKEIQELKKATRLSKENQKLVIEGCLNIVFENTRYWYDYFNKNISIEKIYYICLEALINSVKYMHLHCGKPVFELYINRSIERNIIKHIAIWEHITYRDAYAIINGDILFGEDFKAKKKLNFNYEKDEIEEPQKIYYRLKDESYNVNYIGDISSNEFMNDYKEALNNLDDIEKTVMQLSYDNNGFKGLTYNEISEYLGINYNEVASAKKSALRKLRKDVNLNKYK